MVKGITQDEHWIADFSYVPLVWAAPNLAGFKNNRTAVSLCRMFSITALTYSLLTDAKWGLVKIIPYKTHAALDLASGVAALAVPALVKSVRRNKGARNTFYLMGLTGLVVGALSLIGARSFKDSW